MLLVSRSDAIPLALALVLLVSILKKNQQGSHEETTRADIEHKNI